MRIEYSHRRTRGWESQVELVFFAGLIAGAGLMAAVIFGTDAWYARRHPLVRS